DHRHADLVAVAAVEAEPHDGRLVVLRPLRQQYGDLAGGTGAVGQGYLFHAPVAHAGAEHPVAEELAPGVAAVRLQLALEIGHAQHAEVIARVDTAHEVREAVGAEAVLDHADHAA